ncbi:MAG TPA: hypothetical protein VFV58_30400 [Blastocatellia bacterium]|jgi:hypothetical protein|nr:hypothetical protein [Blastocatellia bacterium]
MKRIFVCLLVLTALSTYASAQDAPVVEWFGGYSYSRVSPDFLADGANTHGFHADITLNTKLLGFVTDVSKTYGESAGTGLSTTTFLIGPRFARHGKKITWFVQSLYGFSYINTDGDIFGPEIGRYDSSFAFVPGGGGIDVKLREKLALRIFQYDLIYTNFGRGGGQLQSRISTGVVLRLGSR